MTAEPTRHPHAELALGATTIAAIIGLVFLLPHPLWSGQPAGPPPPGTPPPPPIGPLGVAIAAIFAVGLCVPFRAYRRAIALVREHGHISTPWLFGLTALLACVALFIYPAYGSDIFDYLGFERMWTVYGDNPLFAQPAAHPQDWATQFVWYADRTPGYGPLWAILTWPLARLAGDSAFGAVLAYKALAALSYAACCAIVWRVAGRERRAASLIAFAWNPLILFEVLAKVHNDILPALACLIAVALSTSASDRRGHVLALAAAAAGGLVKVSTLLCLPLIVLVVRRRSGRWPFLVGVLIATALVILTYAPFWNGPATLASVTNQTSRLIWSPAALSMHAVSIAAATTSQVGLTPEVLAPVVRLVLGLAWLGIAAAITYRVRDTQRVADVASASAWCLLAGVLLLTGAVYAHYLVPVIALSALSNSQRLERAVLWLSIGSLAAYAVEILSSVFGTEWLGSDAASILGSLVLLTPFVVRLVTWRAGATDDRTGEHAPQSSAVTAHDLQPIGSTRRHAA